jgi:hypothetical protein
MMMGSFKVELGNGGPFWIVEAETKADAIRQIAELAGRPESDFV